MAKILEEGPIRRALRERGILKGQSFGQGEVPSLRVAEKVSRNIGILRRELTGKYSCAVAGHHSPQAPVTSRAYWVALITDEEKATIEYKELADKLARGGPLENPYAQAAIHAISKDEERHATDLWIILETFVREGKIV